jgi:hypothetical protein
MAQTHRFGRRIPLPSTVQILHELLVMSAQEDAKQRAAAENKSEGVASRVTTTDAVESERAPADIAAGARKY